MGKRGGRGGRTRACLPACLPELNRWNAHVTRTTDGSSCLYLYVYAFNALACVHTQVGGDVEVGLPDGTNSLALNKWSVGTAYGTATSFASVVAASGKQARAWTYNLPWASVIMRL